MRQERNRGNRNGRKHNGDDNKKKIAIVAAIAIIAIIAYFCFRTTPDIINFDGQSYTVRDVNADGTLTMTNGLKVQLLGVAPNTKCNEFLEENIKGKNVRLTADSKDTKPYFTDASTDLVRAYVSLVDDNAVYNKLNGYILRNNISSFLPDYVNDSLVVFRNYSNPKSKSDNPEIPSSGPNKILSEKELPRVISPATFLIMSAKEDGYALGTGFFINENGVALTNYHVLAGANNNVVFLSDEDGKITPDRSRPIQRILACSKKYDWCIFIVSLDNNEKSPYLNIVRNRPQKGDKVAVVGNPEGYLSTISYGHISNLHIDEGKIQTDASITHGNSGGPICNYKAEVVGIAQSVAANEDGSDATGNLNFGVDIMLLRNALDNLKDVKSYGGK